MKGQIEMEVGKVVGIQVLFTYVWKYHCKIHEFVYPVRVDIYSKNRTSVFITSPLCYNVII